MKKSLLTVASFLLAVFQLAAQKYEAALEKMPEHQPEKLYIHYDKDYYVAGETIWFKAYFYHDGKPSAVANNLYLQFTNEKGVIVSAKKFPVLGAVAKGSIEVPDSLPQGNYYVRALIPEMLNDDEAFIYKKNIFVFNPAAAGKNEKPSSSNVSVQFFPESGFLVDGILSVVGFKAVDQLGQPVEVNGIIKSEEGTTIASFKTYHDGIGKVPFKPQAGKKYVAEVETVAGKRTYPLPEVKATGINLKVQDEKGGKKFQLSRSEKDKALYGKLWVVAQINNHVIYETEIDFEDYPSVIGHLVTDSLPSGILHFTVFNPDGAPLAERLSFVNNQEYLSSTTITSPVFSSEKRAANSVELSFSGTIQRSCSVAVTAYSGTGFGDAENIWSRFLLSSDLKGYIYNQSWYFEQHADSTKQAIDNLLLTHGWSRFNWTKILAAEYPVKKYSDQPMMTISGKVVTEDNKTPLLNGTLSFYMEAGDSTTQNFDAPVDASGKFRMDSLLFSGQAKLFYAYRDTKGKARPALVMLDENRMQPAMEQLPAGLTENMIRRDLSSAAYKNELETRNNFVKVQLDQIKELERVTVTATTNKKPIDQVNEKYTSGVFRTPGKVEIDNINEPANDKSINVVDYVKNRIQQLEIQGGRFVNRKNMSLMTGQKWAVGIFLDEVPTDINQLRVLRMDDVALVKFYEAGFVGVGSGSPGGALAVYTRDKSNRDEKPEKLNYVEYNGYSIIKQYYQPDYTNKEARFPAADYRTTLYWNPDVYTDPETSTFKLNFFNNDFSKKFKVVVEGFDAGGKLIHAEKWIGN